MDNREKLAAYDAQHELFKRPQKIPNLTPVMAPFDTGLDTRWYTYRDTFCTHDMVHSFTPGVKCSFTTYSNGN